MNQVDPEMRALFDKYLRPKKRTKRMMRRLSKGIKRFFEKRKGEKK